MLQNILMLPIISLTAQYGCQRCGRAFFLSNTAPIWPNGVLAAAAKSCIVVAFCPVFDSLSVSTLLVHCLFIKNECFNADIPHLGIWIPLCYSSYCKSLLMRCSFCLLRFSQNLGAPAERRHGHTEAEVVAQRQPL